MSLFLSFLFISKYSGFVNTQQRNGNKHTNWHFMFTKVSRICANLGQSQMFHHFIGICEWTVIASNGFFFHVLFCRCSCCDWSQILLLTGSSNVPNISKYLKLTNAETFLIIKIDCKFSSPSKTSVPAIPAGSQSKL